MSILFGLFAAFVVIAVLCYLGVSPSATSGGGATVETTAVANSSWYDWILVQYLGVPLLEWIAGAVFLLWLLPRLRLGSIITLRLPSTGSVLSQILISFLVMATFFFLLSKIYPDAPLFQPGEGYGHIALYFLLSGLIALVAANFKGKAWFVNTALVVMMFAFLGHRTADLLDPSGKLGSRIASAMPWNWGGGKQVASVTTSNCVGLKTFTLGSQPVPVNPRGFCSVATWLPADGCIYQQPARSKRVFGPLGNCARSIGQKGPPDVEYMWSAENRTLLVDVDLALPHKYD